MSKAIIFNGKGTSIQYDIILMYFQVSVFQEVLFHANSTLREIDDHENHQEGWGQK